MGFPKPHIISSRQSSSAAGRGLGLGGVGAGFRGFRAEGVELGVSDSELEYGDFGSRLGKLGV